MARKRSGMHSQTAYNHFKRLETRYHDCYRQAESYGLTHAALLESLQTRVYSDPAWSKLPAVYRAHLAGWQQATTDAWYRYKLEWRVFWRGRYVESSEVETGTWNECIVDAGAHFWRTRGTDGAMRPFSDMREEASKVA
jgi:hypothetical protein